MKNLIARYVDNCIRAMDFSRIAVVASCSVFVICAESMICSYCQGANLSWIYKPLVNYFEH